MQPVSRQLSGQRLLWGRQCHARAAQVDPPQRRQLLHDAQRRVPAADERAGYIELDQRRRRQRELAISALNHNL